MTDVETLTAAADDLESRGETQISAALRKVADLAATEPTDIRQRIDIRSAVSMARAILRQAAGAAS